MQIMQEQLSAHVLSRHKHIRVQKPLSHILVLRGINPSLGFGILRRSTAYVHVGVPKKKRAPPLRSARKIVHLSTDYGV